ncbi:MAG: hypothetical protein ABI616_13475 [Pseudomonadota bacterium]
MAITTQQASDTLDEVAAAQRKISVLQGYAKGAPHFLLWGVLWAAGYAGTELLPAHAGLLWLAIDAIGLIGSFLLVRANAAPGARSAAGSRSAQSINFFVIALAFAGFIGATYYIMRPDTSAQFGAYPALVMALMYTVIGTRAGARWMVIGVALGVLTVLGYALMREHFMLWMAFVGGGALLLTGVWMRRV